MANDENDASRPVQAVRPLRFGIAGGVFGGVVGYFGFFAALKYASMYTLVMPGALIGLGRAVGSPAKSIPLGVLCGIAALVLSLVIEWQITPMADGETIADFVAQLPDKPFRNLASLAAGPLMALWFGVGRNERGAK